MESATENTSSDGRTVYKVVDSRLGSCLASGKYYVQYRAGEFVTAPEGTKLFVFASLQQANEFRQRLTDQIWRATATGVSVPPNRIGDPTHSIDILDFWQTNNRRKSYGLFAGHRTPPGTLWADSIRLDECVAYFPVEMFRAEPIYHAQLRV
jgi:hypothetical protein